MRIDWETKESVSRDTFDRIRNLLKEKAAFADLIIISDYCKGVVTKELVAAVSELARENGIFCLADPKGMNFSKYENVHVLTPNRKETALASGMEIDSIDDLIPAGEKILESTRLEKLLVTCGKDGMLLFEKDKPPFRIESTARQVFDVSGAGDTVIFHPRALSCSRRVFPAERGSGQCRRRYRGRQSGHRHRKCGRTHRDS